MKRVTPILIILGFLATSVIQAQDPVKEEPRKIELSQKSLTLTEEQKTKIKFNAFLKAAQEEQDFSTAVAKLVAAKKLCGEKDLKDCKENYTKITKLVFDQWVENFEAESDPIESRTGLIQLNQQFCEGDLQGIVNCTALLDNIQTIEPDEEDDYRKDYENYLNQAANAGNLNAELTALRKAEAICETYLKDDCQAEVQTRIQSAYRRSFQSKVRQLRSANLSYETKKDRLEELEDMLQTGTLGNNETQQYNQLAKDIHEAEIERLIGLGGNYSQRQRNLEDAQRINERELNGQMQSRIDQVRIALVDDSINDLVRDLRRSRGFNNQIRQVEAAEELLNDLPDYARNQRLNQIRDLRRDVVENELTNRRRSLLNNTTDWRATLNGYETLLQFAQRYAGDLDRNIRRQLLQDRQNFTIGEYEARIQQSVGLLQRQDLQGAQLALAGAVQLASTNILPEGPAKYRHRELYQKLYDEHHRQLQLAKANRNWTQAEQSIGWIDNLYAEAPFILARASIQEEMILLDIAKFEADLEQADQVLRQAPQAERFNYFRSLIDGYQVLRPNLNNGHRDQLGRLAVVLSEEPLKDARTAIGRNDYGRALSALKPLNAFLYEGNYRSVLPDRAYQDMNQLIEASADRQIGIFKNAITNLQNADQEQKTIAAMTSFTGALSDLQGWNESTTGLRISDLYRQLLLRKKDNMISRMQTGNLDYLGELAQIENLQSNQQDYIDRAFVTGIAQELDFYGTYETAKAALRRLDFNQSMNAFRSAQDKVAQLPAEGRLEKAGLIENGLRKSLEGQLTAMIKRNQNIGEAAEKEVYRQILGLRLAHEDIALTQEAEYTLKEAELSWFGGGCRQDYRSYTLEVLKAEQAIAEKDYARAIPSLETAQDLKRRIDRCMLPMDDIGEQLEFYQLAVDFNERKANLDRLYENRQWAAFSEEYHQLWMAYQDYGIQQKFGYPMEPFGTYVLRTEQPELMEYYVLNYCMDDQEIDNVAEAIKNLTYRMSKQRMQQLGGEVAQRMYPVFPSRKYQTSFAFLTSKGKADKKGFKAFKKGYKKAWKRLR